MDSEQLQRLATDARLNHWPPHLGVTTDAEKVEYLARQLDEAAQTIGWLGDQAAEVGRLEKDLAELENENGELKVQIVELKKAKG